MVSDTTLAEQPPPRAPRALRLATAYVSVAMALISAVIGAVIWLPSIEPTSGKTLTYAVMPIDAAPNDFELVALGNLLQEQALVELSRRTASTGSVLARPAVEALRGSSRNVEQMRMIGADFWIDATLQRVGDHVRLHAKVARSSDMRLLWIDDFELPLTTYRDYRQRFAAELAQRLLSASVQQTPVAMRGGEDVADGILAGRVRLEQHPLDELPAAVAQLESAVAAQPHRVDARGLLARALTLRALDNNSTPRELSDAARDHALTALRHNPENRDALAALGGLQLWIDWNLSAAGPTLAKAASGEQATRHGRSWYVEWLSATGQHVAAVDAARVLDSLAPATLDDPVLARALLLADRMHEAAAAARITLALHPQSAPAAWIAALAHAAATGQALPDETKRQVLGRASAGNARAAAPAAMIAMLEGDDDEAMKWVTSAVNGHAPGAVFFASHPLLRPLHARADFQQLLAKIAR